MNNENFIPFSGWEALNPEREHFAILGDTQSASLLPLWKDLSPQAHLLKEIARRKPAFVIHLGDLNLWGSSSSQWKDFENLHKPFLEKKIPYFPLLGNHDRYIFPSRALQNYFRHFPHLKEQKWYSFEWKGLAFLLLDGNYFRLSKQSRRAQILWYEEKFNEYETNPAIQKILLFCHFPPYTNSKIVSPSGAVRDFFLPLFFESKKASAFFSGHCHSYEKFKVQNKWFFVCGGGGAPFQRLEIRPEKRRFPDLFNGPAFRFFHFCEIKTRPSLSIEIIQPQKDGLFSVADSADL